MPLETTPIQLTKTFGMSLTFSVAFLVVFSAVLLVYAIYKGHVTGVPLADGTLH